MRGPDYKGDMAAIHSSLKKCLDLMFNAMYECVDEDAKRYAQDCVDGIETWIENCKRKGGIESSRKPIKSDYKGLDEEVGDLQIDMTNTGYFEDGWLLLEGENEEGYRDGTEFTINAYGLNGEDLGSKKFDFLDLWHNGRPVNSSRKPDVNSSIQGQERAIQAIMDEYGCTREEAIDIMNNDVTSGCHSKAKKKAKKEIKSSLMDEFEESYTAAASNWSEEEYNALLDDFITDFAKEHNITYEEVEKMQKQLEDKWYKDSDNASIVDIYSSANRNEKNLNCIFKN